MHAVIRYEKMITALHDLVRGIIEQIILVKGQAQRGREIIIKIVLLQINGGRYINSVIAEIEQRDHFF